MENLILQRLWTVVAYLWSVSFIVAAVILNIANRFDADSLLMASLILIPTSQLPRLVTYVVTGSLNLVPNFESQD